MATSSRSQSSRTSTRAKDASPRSRRSSSRASSADPTVSEASAPGSAQTAAGWATAVTGAASGSGVSRISRQVIASASCSSTRPSRGSPVPVTSLTASVTMTAPTVAGSMPKTPPSAQLGTSPSGGASG